MLIKSAIKQIISISKNVQEEHTHLEETRNAAYKTWQESSSEVDKFVKANTPAGAMYYEGNFISSGFYVSYSGY